MFRNGPGPLGYLSSSPGVRMSGFDQIDVMFHGVGGHSAQRWLTIDSVVMAAQAVLAYQTIVSRNVNPQGAGVLTVGAITAGRDNKLIPQSAEVRMTMRWTTPEVREQLIKRIDAISRGSVVAAGVPADNKPRA